MGNETSQLSGLKVSEKAVEVTDHWMHHSASITNSDITEELSVFTNAFLSETNFSSSKVPLQIYSKNLMLYRHPCILKYISSWKKNSKYYLAVENVRPLNLELAAQSTLQICIGLQSVLKALVFLHEKAKASHNNICTASIYVTKDGNWKLGGLEFLCKLENLSEDYLARIRPHRYEKAIDPNEKSFSKESLQDNNVDNYAFGVFVQEILHKRLEDDIPSMKPFYSICKNDLQDPDVNIRPNLNCLLSHTFFTHEFMAIHSFLNELPLKSETEKTHFFSDLSEKLQKFPEKTVAENLGNLLLSRLVLLDSTARDSLLPFLLRPKDDDALEIDPYIFRKSTFIQFIVPKLVQIFKVTDIQIRKLLLIHFEYFMDCFNKDQLQNHILPELLLGIKDTNDHLVSMTLRALADLVPVLGAAIVIGGKRSKLFSDGRPLSHHSKQIVDVNLTSAISETFTLNQSDVPAPSFCKTTVESSNQIMYLSERPSPDGGEDNNSSIVDAEHAVTEDLEWSDWDIQENAPNQIHEVFVENSYVKEDTPSDEKGSYIAQLVETENTNPTELENSQPSLLASNYKPSDMVDISELDIKNQSNKCSKLKFDEFNYFEDMEPVIETTNKFLINESLSTNPSNNLVNVVSNLAIKTDLLTIEDGWGDDLNWSVDNEA